MKKLFVLMLVLGLAAVASAELKLSVNGVVDPPDTEISLKEGQTAVIDVWGDGTTKPYAYLLGISIDSVGPGSLDIGTADVLYTGSEAMIDWMDDADFAAEGRVLNPFIYMEMTDVALEPAPLDGTLFDNIIFTCDGLGDVILTLFDADYEVMDQQLIHQVPEPMTLALLGLGGLFLRRRK